MPFPMLEFSLNGKHWKKNRTPVVKIGINDMQSKITLEEL